ncbi:MAG: hypothetical protein HN750_04950 [Gemmatimonadales bacterium]|nr:hypothetical protein [Gemmatimonadales bacterium]
MKSARLQPLTAEAPEAAPELQAPWAAFQLQGGTWERADGTIDSVQWVDLPDASGLDLEALEPVYFDWVPRLSVGMVSHRGREEMSLACEPFRFPTLIRLEPAKRTETTRTRGILGGMLAYPGGSIGFATYALPAGTRLVVAVRALKPRLPRWLYFIVQAQMHERSTFGFLRQIAAATLRASSDC